MGKPGKISQYNPVNRFGYVKPEGGGPAIGFYLNVVSNAEPAPKEDDVVTFDAPDPRKNKKGKMVQDYATSITIEERAPEKPPAPPKKKAGEKRAGPKGRGAKGRGQQRREQKGGKKPRRSRPEIPSKEKVFAELESKRMRRDKKPKQEPISSHGRLPLARDVDFRLLDEQQANPSLLLQKFIQWPKPDPAKLKTKKPRWTLSEKNKRYFLNKVFLPFYRAFHKNQAPWAEHRDRRRNLLTRLDEQGYAVYSQKLETESRLSVGPAQPSILENSTISLDYLYGFPIIPAKTIKGLAKRHAKELMERDEDVISASLLNSIFGAPGEPGKVLFFDAICVDRLAKLEVDAMSCHAQNWYYGRALASDDQEPREFFFLTVGPGEEFEFVVATESKDDCKLAEIALQLVQDAVQTSGIGARRAVGYGYFS